MATHNDLGRIGEELAAGFMQQKGYQILDRNYRFKKAEVDIVAFSMEPAELVFIEVKTRSTNDFGYPEEAISTTKLQRIFQVADAYIYEKRMTTVPIRFDVIAISMELPEHPLIHHIEDAYRPTNF